MDTLRHLWAAATAFVSVLAGTMDLSAVLTALGVLVALLTIVERVYTIRLKHRQLDDDER
jgi:hypothetical protein